MKTINRATEQRVRQLAQARAYSYRHIQTLVEIEGLGKPSLSFIGKIVKQVKAKKFIKKLFKSR